MNRFVTTLLISFLILFAVFTWLNHSCFVQSDPHIFLNFASSLAEEDYFIDYPPEKLLIENLPPENYYRTFYGHIVKGGKSFSFVGIGYPLFLSLFIRWGGIYAPFFANGVVFIGLFTALYLFIRQLFKNNPYNSVIAIISVLLYFIIQRQNIIYLLRTYRDPLSYTFTLLGMWLFLKFTNTGKQYPLLALAGLFIGLACTARETAFLSVLPLAMVFFVRSVRHRSYRVIKPGLVLVLFFIIGSSPLLVQNYVNSGNPLLHTQNLARRGMAAANKQEKTGIAGFIVPGSKLEYFRKASYGYARQLLGQYGVAFSILFLLGVYYGRKNDAVLFLLLPFIIIYLLFYSFLGRSPWRYIFVIQMAVVPLLAYAVFRLAETVLKPDEKCFKLGLIILFGLTSYRMFAEVPEKPFQVKQARAFADDLDRVVPDNSLILAERTLRSNIDYFTKSYCIRLGDILKSPPALTAKSAIERLMSRFSAVYFFDNTDLGLYHKFNYTPVTRQIILDHFDLRHVKDFSGKDYNLQELFGKDVCSLWKVTRWKQNRSRKSIQISRIEESVLMINARKLWDNDYERTRAELYFNDNLLDSAVEDGINFMLVPERLLTKTNSVIELRSDAPVPADIEPKLQSIYDPITIDMGSESVPLDGNFVSGFSPSVRSQYRCLTRESRIQIPAIDIPDSFLIGRAVLFLPQTNTADCNLIIFVNGEEVFRKEVKRFISPQYFEFLIPTRLTQGSYAELSFDLELVDKKGQRLLDQTIPEEFLLLDQLVIERKFLKLRQPLIDVGAEDEIYIKAGLHKPEQYKGKHSVRWTRRKAVLRLPDLDPERGYILKINAWGCPEVIGERVSAVYFNGHKLGEMRVAPEERQSFTFDISPPILAVGLNELTIITPIWRPRYITNTLDKRLLGIMLDSIILDRASSIPE